ncbi:hypothetical protein [Shewanella indica]|uniref:hypothetical protein n=1 Tax=Shewanella indica TaxID=768528 RepID=UPI0030069164
MPFITDKEHRVSLKSSEQRKADGFEQITSKPFTWVAGLDNCHYNFFRRQDGSQGCLSVTIDGLTIAELEFRFIEDLGLDVTAVQIFSVFVHKDYRWLGLGPSSYPALLQNVDYIVSDNEQTESGAVLWGVKLASNEELSIRVLDRALEGSPEFGLDGPEQHATFSFDGNSFSIDPSTIWSIDDMQGRYEHELPFSPHTSECRRHVTLVASLKNP